MRRSTRKNPSGGRSLRSRTSKAGRVVARASLLALGLGISAWIAETVLTRVPNLVANERFRATAKHWMEKHGDLPSLRTQQRIWASQGDVITGRAADVRPIPSSEDRLLANFIYRTNELGFRGTGPVKRNYPLVAIGDSFTGASNVESPWPDVLGQRLNIDVLNLGLPGGGGPYREVVALRDLGVSRRPKIIVMGYFEGNDLMDCGCEIEPYNKLPIRKTYNEWFLADLPSFGIELYERLVAPSRNVLRRTYAKLLPPRRLIPVPIREPGPPLKELPRDFIYPIELKIGDRALQMALARHYVSIMGLSPLEICTSRNLWIAGLSFLLAKKRAVEAGAQLLVAYFPSKERVYWPLIEQNPHLKNRVLEDQQFLLVNDDGCLAKKPIGKGHVPTETLARRIHLHRNAQRDSVRQVAAGLQVHFVDLSAVFEQVAREGTEVYYPYDTHWNQKGHELAAQTIASYIQREMPILPTGDGKS